MWRFSLLVALAVGVVATPARAQGVETLIPPQSSVFGQPGLRLPGEPPPPEAAPNLRSPADVGDKSAAGRGPADPNADLAFGAYQRGFYSTAMREAMKRLGNNSKDAPAMTLVGELYGEGLGVKQSKEQAARWFRLGAEAGDPRAMFALGMAEMKGEGVEQDRAAARVMFEKAAAQDHPGAMFYLGMMAMQGNGVAPDTKSAIAYFRKAADLGHSDAEYALGLLYRKGDGVPQDEAKAAKLIAAAAANDNIAAMVEYGIMQFNGIGTPKDEAAAARLFIKAAGRNNPVAQDRAARVYVSGRGVKKDIIEGMKWHLLSRAAGLRDEWLESEMRTLTREQREAVDKALRRYLGS